MPELRSSRFPESGPFAGCACYLITACTAHGTIHAHAPATCPLAAHIIRAYGVDGSNVCGAKSCSSPGPKAIRAGTNVDRAFRRAGTLKSSNSTILAWECLA